MICHLINNIYKFYFYQRSSSIWGKVFMMYAIIYQVQSEKNVPGLFFEFCREIARTKTKQSTEKAIEHNGSTLIPRDLVLRCHQQ